MKTINSFDAIRQPRPGQTFDKEKYPDQAVPGMTPTLAELVDRHRALGEEPDQKGAVFSGADPFLNVPFSVRKDRLLVSAFVRDSIYEGAKGVAVETKYKAIIEKRQEMAKLKRQGEEDLAFKKKLDQYLKEHGSITA